MLITVLNTISALYLKTLKRSYSICHNVLNQSNSIKTTSVVILSVYLRLDDNDDDSYIFNIIQLYR